MSRKLMEDPQPNVSAPEPPQDGKELFRTAGRAGGIMAGALLLSRVLGLLRDTVIAGKFGLLAANDSYRIATQIPDLIFMLIAGGGLSSAFIPVFAEFWYTDRRKEAWRVFSVVVTVCSIIAVALIAIAWALAPTIVTSYAHGRQDVVPDAILMSRIMLPAQYAFLIGSVFLGTLYARKQFIGPGLAPNVYNLGIIFGAAVISNFVHPGIIGVAWGALIGAFIGNILLPLIMIAPQGMEFRPSLQLKTPGVGKFFALLLPVILGFSLPSMVSLITQYFASPFGEGSNTALSYSNNLMQAPLGIFGASYALGVFPVLSQLFAEKRLQDYCALVSRTMRTVLYLAVPSAALMFALAPLLVKIIYGYGKAGGQPQQLALIATCLQIYCVAVPIWCLQPVLIRAFFSLHNTLKPVAIGTAMTVLYIILCLIIRAGGYPIEALPWATNISATLLVIVLFIALERDAGKLDHKGLLITLGKSLLAATIAGAIGYAGSTFYEPSRKLLAIVWFLFLAAATGAIYLLITKLLKMPEIQRARLPRWLTFNASGREEP